MSELTNRSSSGSRYGFEAFVFDGHAQALSRDGVEIPLPPRVTALLCILLEQSGGLVAKERLIETIWKGSYVGDASLSEAISQLRAALSDDPRNPRFIQTVHRRGYRFIGKVEFLADKPSGGMASPDRRKLVWPWALAAGSMLLVGVLWMSFRSPPARVAEPTRFSIPLPGGYELSPARPLLAISPDGRDLVFSARIDGKSELLRRSLSRIETLPIPGTEGATAPFFSPSGTSIAFFAGGKLKRLDLDKPAILEICDAPLSRGGSWSSTGEIYFTGGYGGGLWVVPESGGAPRPRTSPDAVAGEVGHWWPEVLPDGKAVLFTVWSTGFSSSHVALIEEGEQEPRVLIEGGSSARFAPPDRLFYSRAGSLLMAPFDLDNLELTGPPQTIGESVWTHSLLGLAHYDAAANGSLVFLPASGEPVSRSVFLVPPTGPAVDLRLPPRLYSGLAPAPQGSYLIASIHEDEQSHLWLYRAHSEPLQRLTFEGFNFEPVWSPDAQKVTFASNRAGAFDIYRRQLTGESRAELLYRSSRNKFPETWHPNGEILAFSEAHPTRGLDLWLLRNRHGDWQAEPYRISRNNEAFSTFSPDGRWLAYASDESGSWQVYVESYPSGEGRWQVSADGGGFPSWSSDGSDLKFFRGGQLFRVLWSLENGQRVWEPPTVADYDLPAGDQPIAMHGDSVLTIRESSRAEKPLIQWMLHWRPSEESAQD